MYAREWPLNLRDKIEVEGIVEMDKQLGHAFQLAQ